MSIPVDVMEKTLTRDKGHKRILSHSRLEKSDYRNVGFLKKPLSPIYLVSFMRVLLPVGVDANDQNLLQRGALL